MYEDYDLLAENHECQFQSTVPEYENPQDLLSALKRGELTNFQAFWWEGLTIFPKYNHTWSQYTEMKCHSFYFTDVSSCWRFFFNNLEM